MDWIMAGTVVSGGLLLGGMVFFSAVVAPLVFVKLPEQEAARFIRALFPFYYLYGALTAAACAVLMFAVNITLAVVVALVAGLFVYARQVLMPQINAARDAEQGGDAAAGRRFRYLHRWSVTLNAVQLLGVLAALARVAGS
ncbi:DUF4149 domain-containing protein [Futiania mangrovi]|uniref:DUF4149 domain-containing protein n=1 Tax=Futiania mangrovi TaxID=2959716 RepID=A0A9J6PBW9_9PROT|nr:DUF4149 domain-containing protein [Futiania mangrovii]MCP1337668.1 DUF4149 domain-containing protein [Futiania mangrovii]